jgi:hypothetical protein
MESNLATLGTLRATNMLRLGNQNTAILGSTQVDRDMGEAISKADISSITYV